MRPKGRGRHLPSHSTGDFVAYWLMKSEPSECSIDDLVQQGQVAWTGVRNYQSRNFMRDDMCIGDGVLFYHSTCAQPGIAGLATVASAAYADPTQFDASSKYFEPKSNPAAPRWLLVDVKLMRKTRLLALNEMRGRPELASMRVLARGNRLSITPVSAAHWRAVQALLQKPA